MVVEFLTFVNNVDEAVDGGVEEGRRVEGSKGGGEEGSADE